MNARIETIDEKPSFRNSTFNRCLVIATAFFEWHWNDEKGKSKDKYKISSAEAELFAFAGIYDIWINPTTGTQYNSFSIVTTAANKQMEFIRNHKKRMPIILKKEDEMVWLEDKNTIHDFAYPYSADLIAIKIS